MSQTISLKTTVKNRVKDGQRQNDYDFTVKFWNKLLREGKMSAKNHKCTDETLWAALVRNYEVWGKQLEDEVSEERIRLLQRKMSELRRYFNGDWKDEALEYYQRIDPSAQIKIKAKVKDYFLPQNYSE